MMKKYAFIVMAVGFMAIVNISANEIDCIQKQLAAVDGAKESVIVELRDTSIIARKAKLAAKKSLGDSYDMLKAQVQDAIDRIIYSQEFITAMNELIDYQIRCICEENMAFEDIPYEYNSALVRKIDLELDQEFPELDDTINMFFDILYVTRVNGRGCALLFEKLEKKERQLKKALSEKVA